MNGISSYLSVSLYIAIGNSGSKALKIIVALDVLICKKSSISKAFSRSRPFGTPKPNTIFITAIHINAKNKAFQKARPFAAPCCRRHLLKIFYPPIHTERPKPASSLRRYSISFFSGGGQLEKEYSISKAAYLEEPRR